MDDCMPGFDIDGVWVPLATPVDWDAAFRHFEPAVRAYVRARVAPAAVDDAVQDTFERAFRSRDRFDPTRPLWPWLVTIAKRACSESARYRRHEVVIDISDQVPGGDEPPREYERRVQAVAISHALATLTPRHRRLLVGWEVEGRSFDGLAAEEGLTKQALKSVICRARHGFRIGYADVAERAGLAAFAFGRLLGRQRERLHRAVSMGHGGELALGGVLLGVTAVTLLGAMPMARSDAKATGASAVDRAAAAHAAAPALALPSPSADTRPETADGPNLGEGAEAGAPSGPRARPPMVPRAGGGADVRVTEQGPKAALTVDVGDQWGTVEATATVSIDCTDGVYDLACLVIRSTPLGS